MSCARRDGREGGKGAGGQGQDPFARIAIRPQPISPIVIPNPFPPAAAHTQPRPGRPQDHPLREPGAYHRGHVETRRWPAAVGGSPGGGAASPLREGGAGGRGEGPSGREGQRPALAGRRRVRTVDGAGSPLPPSYPASRSPSSDPYPTFRSIPLPAKPLVKCSSFTPSRPKR
jgi:hypothetical protein